MCCEWSANTKASGVMKAHDSRVLSLLCCYFAAAGCAKGSTLLLEGILIAKALGTDKAARYDFAAWVEENKVRIRTSRLSESKPLEHVDYFSDGSVSHTCIVNLEPAKFRLPFVQQHTAREELR